MAEALLTLEKLAAGYGAAQVIGGIDLTLAEGRSLAVLGRNGVGKTTLINTIIGATRQMGGRILLSGRDLSHVRAYQRARAGIGWVPQERNIFKSLSVDENLSAVALPGRWDSAAVYQLFPRLAERKANMGNQLSGGEQQMLAIGRALMLNPRLLLLDEPTEGLAPIIIDELMAALRRLTREDGLSSIIVEQHAQKILKVTDDVIILDRGSIVHAGPSAALIEKPDVLELHLGVARKPIMKMSDKQGAA